MVVDPFLNQTFIAICSESLLASLIGGIFCPNTALVLLFFYLFFFSLWGGADRCSSENTRMFFSHPMQQYDRKGGH